MILYRKEVLSVIPRNAQNLVDVSAQYWVHLVHAELREIDRINPQRSKIEFLGNLLYTILYNLSQMHFIY